MSGPQNYIYSICSFLIEQLLIFKISISSDAINFSLCIAFIDIRWKDFIWYRFLTVEVFLQFLNSNSSQTIIIFQKKMKSSFSQQEGNKRRYSKISIKRRERLVQMIIQQDFTIAKASKRLGIKASTARMILNKYKETGQFPMKHFKEIQKIESITPPAPLVPKGSNINTVENAPHFLANTAVEQSLFNRAQDVYRGIPYQLLYFWFYPTYQQQPLIL